jgi:hypothetical protein
MFTQGTKLQPSNFDIDYSMIKKMADSAYESRIRVADDIGKAIDSVSERFEKKRKDEETKAGYSAIAGQVIPDYNDMPEKEQKAVINALMNDSNFTTNLKNFVGIQETLAELNPAGGVVQQDFPMETVNQYLVGRVEDDPDTEEDEFVMGKLMQLGFNQETGDFGYTKTENGIRKFEVIPQEDAIRMSESSIQNNTKVLNESLSKLREEQGSMIRAKNYVDNRLSTPSGFKNFITRLQAAIKTASGQELNEEQIRTRLSEGQFQALIGEIREQIVGGGVMTEKDAERIEKALGEYGITSDPEVVRRAIGEVMQRKIQAEKDLIARFESASRRDPMTYSTAQSYNVSPVDLGDTFTPRGEVFVNVDGVSTPLGVRMVGEVIDLGNGQKARVNEKFELEAIEQ